MPMARMTFSTVTVCVSFPASTATAMPSFPFVSPATVAPVRTFMPCFSTALRTKAEISASSTGRMRSSISTTVTSAPSVR